MNENYSPSELSQINNAVAKLVCPDHNKSPVVDFSETKPNYSNLCCGNLETMCINEISGQVAIITTLRNLGL